MEPIHGTTSHESNFILLKIGVIGAKNDTAWRSAWSSSFAYAPLPRLSVDIDINYVGEADRSRMLEDKPKFQERFLGIMDSKGYEVVRSASKGLSHLSGR